MFDQLGVFQALSGASSVMRLEAHRRGAGGHGRRDRRGRRASAACVANVRSSGRCRPRSRDEASLSRRAWSGSQTRTDDAQAEEVFHRALSRPTTTCCTSSQHGVTPPQGAGPRVAATHGEDGRRSKTAAPRLRSARGLEPQLCLQADAAGRERGPDANDALLDLLAAFERDHQHADTCTRHGEAEHRDRDASVARGIVGLLLVRDDVRGRRGRDPRWRSRRHSNPTLPTA